MSGVPINALKLDPRIEETTTTGEARRWDCAATGLGDLETSGLETADVGVPDSELRLSVLGSGPGGLGGPAVPWWWSSRACPALQELVCAAEVEKKGGESRIEEKEGMMLRMVGDVGEEG
jgi:hypothetical protein